MMKTSKWYFIFFSCMILFTQCKKENSVLTEGEYEGIFTVSYTNEKQSGNVHLTLKDGRFTCSEGQHRIPAGGSGTYKIDGNSIVFSDENFWTADFDWNLILNGTYSYSYDGKNLLLSAAKNQVGKYEYKLIKK